MVKRVKFKILLMWLFVPITTVTALLYMKSSPISFSLSLNDGIIRQQLPVIVVQNETSARASARKDCAGCNQPTPKQISPRYKRTVDLSTVHISIKSTENVPVSRLPILGMTWLKTVPSKNVFIVTDKKDRVTMKLADQGYNVYYSRCSTKKWHGRVALSCKCGNEFKLYYEQVEAGRNYKWYCHFDDDVYVNSMELQKLLSSYDHESIYYLGRRSLDHDMHVKKTTNHKLIPTKKKNYTFADGPAYCMSKKLMNEMKSFVRGKNFVAISSDQSTPDDITIGFIVGDIITISLYYSEAVLGYNLTEIYRFNSHHSPNLKSLTVMELPKQITISYKFLQNKTNVRTVNLPNGTFDRNRDPTRFFSYHCLLYPSVSWCVSQKNSNSQKVLLKKNWPKKPKINNHYIT